MTLCFSVKKVLKMKTFLILYMSSACTVRVSDVTGEFAQIKKSLFPTSNGICCDMRGKKCSFLTDSFHPFDSGISYRIN